MIRSIYVPINYALKKEWWYLLESDDKFRAVVNLAEPETDVALTSGGLQDSRGDTTSSNRSSFVGSIIGVVVGCMLVAWTPPTRGLSAVTVTSSTMTAFQYHAIKSISILILLRRRLLVTTTTTTTTVVLGFCILTVCAAVLLLWLRTRLQLPRKEIIVTAAIATGSVQHTGTGLAHDISVISPLVRAPTILLRLLLPLLLL
jgi:hypothetical protein